MTPAWLLAIALGAAACGMTRDVTLSAEDSAELQDRAVRVEQWLSDTSMGPATGVPIARWILPSALNEISGLALTSDGNLLAHGDEIGRISVVDPRRGVILKEFSIGAKGDFEGITVANGTIYLVTSNGQIYSFREGGPGERVSYQLHDTRLGNECEFEGIAYDARREAMLLQECPQEVAAQQHRHLHLESGPVEFTARLGAHGPPAQCHREQPVGDAAAHRHHDRSAHGQLRARGGPGTRHS
jgi:hypothetical protein